MLRKKTLALVSFVFAVFVSAAFADVTMTSFQLGGAASSTAIHVDQSDVGVYGFGVQGSTVAFWGGSGRSTTGYSSSYASMTLFTGTTTGLFGRTDISCPSGQFIAQPQGGLFRTITFDSADRPVVSFSSRTASGTNGADTFVVSYDDVSGGFAKTLLASHTPIPRHSAIAVGNEGQIAVYSGGWSDSAEIIVNDGSALDRYVAPTSYLGPLAFDPNGTLHQAGVVEHGGYRDLAYLSRTPDGVWSQEIIDTTQGSGGNMTGHVDLALNGSGAPVIIGNSAGDAWSLSVHELGNSGWYERSIALAPIAQELGIGRFEGGYAKQVVFDSQGRAHLTLVNGFGDLIYMAFSSDWNLLESRRFAGVSGFYGMGLDDAGKVWLGYEGTTGDGSVPAPGAALLCVIGLGMVNWVKRRFA